MGWHWTLEDGEWWVTVAEWEEECLGGGETGGDDSDEDWDEYWEDWDEDCDDEWYEDYCMEAWWLAARKTTAGGTGPRKMATFGSPSLIGRPNADRTGEEHHDAATAHLAGDPRHLRKLHGFGQTPVCRAHAWRGLIYSL